MMFGKLLKMGKRPTDPSFARPFVSGVLCVLLLLFVLPCAAFAQQAAGGATPGGPR